MKPHSIRKLVAAGTLACLSMLLSACFLMPGKFNSTLDLRKDGAFRFAYTGEMYMLPFSDLAAQNRTFKEEPCYEDGSMDERPCTSAEVSEQKEEWERRAEKDKREAESAKIFLGGIDPSDPEAADELVKRLRNQEGWQRVEYKGDGLFDVDFAITGRLTHDFAFPTIERFPMSGGFVQVAIHRDGTVRIDAPGFGPSTGAAPFGNMMQAAAMASEKEGGKAPNIPEMDGMFTINTDGEILANNTETGPQSIAIGRSLTWKVTSRAQAAPTALIRMKP